VTALSLAIEQDDASAAAHCNLGTALAGLGQYDDAVASFHRALAIAPEHVDAEANLGATLRDQGRLGAAAAAFERAIARDPRHADALANLAGARAEQGRAAEAIALYRRALAADPRRADAHSGLLLALHYDDCIDADALHAEHRRWAACHVASVAAFTDHPDNRPQPERRLRLGYVSPNLRAHSVAYFIEPVLAAHDRRGFEVFAYADVARPDAITQRLRGLVDVWRDLGGHDDDAVAAQVRADRIDILVDLAGHTGGHRLGVFARRPAPLAISYLGYPDTTGLGAIDYRLSDARADPPGIADRRCRETLIRLDGGFLCYRPPEDAPGVAPLPALARGTVTFGSFNNLAKLSPTTLKLWSAVLDAVPGSRLMLKARALGDAETRDRVAKLFAERGIAADRLDLYGQATSVAAHLALYREIDIGLDPAPYNGATTTCEALWMGVPVITLAGDRHAGRVGASLLGGLGLDDMIAPSPDAYVATAAKYAADRDRLAGLRATLRTRVLRGPLTDAKGFTQGLEATYRTLWRRWCESVGA